MEVGAGTAPGAAVNGGDEGAEESSPQAMEAKINASTATETNI